MLLGADPEFFIVDTKYQIINSYRVIKKNKNKPVKINNFKFFYDNVAIEANFNPCNTKEKFLSELDGMFLELKFICSTFLLEYHPFFLIIQLIHIKEEILLERLAAIKAKNMV